MEETVGIGKECSRLAKHLCVGCPSQSLVALRTVSGHRKIVRQLSPAGIADQLIDGSIARGDGSRFQALGNGSDRHRLDVADHHLVGSRDRDIPIAEKGATGRKRNKAVIITKSIYQTEMVVLCAEIPAMHTALWAIHPSPLGTIAVVQYLSGETGEPRPLLGFEYEGRHTGTILAEVNHQRLIGFNHQWLPLGKFTLDDHRSVFHLLFLL